MNELKRKLYQLSLAIKFDKAQIKQLYTSNVLTDVDYIKVTDLMNQDRQQLEIEQQKYLKQYQELVEIEAEKNRLSDEKRLANQERRKEQVHDTKQKLKEVTDLTNEQKQKVKKYSVLVVSLIIGLLIVIIGIMYIFNNFVGFISVDLSDYAIVSYDKSEFATSPTLTGTWELYNENGYYDDEINRLVDSRIYSESEASALMPADETALKVQTIVTGYDLSTNEPLTNGEVVEATISYDKELAHSHKIKVTNNVMEISISGLSEQATAEDITLDMLNSIPFNEEDALTKARDYVYNDEDYSFDVVDTKYYFSEEHADDYYFAADNEPTIDALVSGMVFKFITVSKTKNNDSENVRYYTYYQTYPVLKNEEQTVLYIDNDPYTNRRDGDMAETIENISSNIEIQEISGGEIV